MVEKATLSNDRPASQKYHNKYTRNPPHVLSSSFLLQRRRRRTVLEVREAEAAQHQ